MKLYNLANISIKFCRLEVSTEQISFSFERSPFSEVIPQILKNLRNKGGCRDRLLSKD